MPEPTTELLPVTNGEAPPELPPPVAIPEYYAGFATEFEQIGVELQRSYARMLTAEANLAKPLPYHILGIPEQAASFWQILKSILPFVPGATAEATMERFMTPEQEAVIKAEAMAIFDTAARDFQVSEWKLEVMQVMPVYLSDPFYVIEKPEDILQYVASGTDLTDADTAWLRQTYDKLSHLSNVLPEDFQGDVLEAQSKVIDEILTEPKVELKGVHRLTVDEIAKAFTFGVTALPPGMSEQDVRDLLSKLEIDDEEIKTEREWLAERAREWELEAARMNLIRAGTILAETPELTPIEQLELTFTQPMMATVELMQKWWDSISRPLSAAITMHLPAPVAGAVHGAPLGLAGGGMVGAAIGAFGGPIGMGVGAIIGTIVGAISGAALFSVFESDADKELTKHYEFYREQGESAWSSYAKAFNEWDAPWWKKMILDSAYDPLMWIGWGGVAAIGKKLATAALPRGLKWAGSRVGSLMVAFEQGYVSAADAVFKAGLQVVAAPIKSAFWLTGAGYTIPATFTQMARNFGRKSLMDFKAVLDRTFPRVRNLRGLTAKDVHNTAEAVIRSALANPMDGTNPAVRAGTNILEFNYLDDALAAKFVAEAAGSVTFDVPRLARFNSNLLDAFSGQGNRITAGKMLGDLGVEATEQSVASLATKIGKFKDTVAKKAMDALKGDTADDLLMSIFNRAETTRYANLHSPLTKWMQQAGRSASWHSRVADRILYSAGLVALERRVVMPIARWQLLFTNFGPFNYAENMGRSFLGGAEVMYPKAYSGVAETNRLFRGLSGAPYELRLFEQGQIRTTQAVIDPKTGMTAVFKGGKIPFITKNVRMPEKIPKWGGKMLGKTINIGDQRFFMGSAQDWYDMWGKLTVDQTSYDFQVHFLKALEDIAPDDMRAISEILEVKTKHLLDDIPSITKRDAFDIRRELKLEIVGGGPESIRGFADIDVITMQRRQISKELNKTFDKMTDIHTITKKGIENEVLDGTMFARGTDSIDDRITAFMASERELNIASLTNQMDALRLEADAFIANPPRNLDDFLGDMQSITAHAEGVGERIHDFLRITRLRKADLRKAGYAKAMFGELDDFEVGSAKMLAEFMGTSEEQLTKMMNQLMKNAKAAGLNDVQLARLADLDSITRLELDNILATRTKVAEVRAIIPRTPRRLRNDAFWAQQDDAVAGIWNDYDFLARRHKGMKLAASRNFLTSVDKSVYVPDFVPEVVGELTPNHLAYLYGVTGDDLYRGLTRIQHHATVRPRADFIVHTKDQANAYAAKLGKTADQIGFTDEAIGEVYDQMWKNLGVDPSILTPDHPTMLQLEEVRQEMHRLYGSTRIPESDVIKWRKYINSVADEAEQLGAYKVAPAIAPVGKANIKQARLFVKDMNTKYSTGRFRAEFATNFDEELFGKDRSIVVLKSIFTDEPVRAKGLASNAMRDIVNDADSRGITLKLVAVPTEGVGLTEEQLIRWYGKFGFSFEYGVYGTRIPSGPPRVPPVAEGISGTPDWWAKKESAMTRAREMHSLSYPTYEDANIIDETMRAIFPFWNYELFRWKWLPRTFLRTPGVMSALGRYMTNTDQGYMPVPGTDLQINILRGTVFMGGLRSFYLRDFPEYHDAAPGIEFLDYIGRAGFFPGVHVMLPIILFGAGEEPPQFGQLAPAWIKTGLSALRVLSPEHIGNILELVYPDRFRDYMTMLTLGGMGYDADEIWNKKQQGIKLTEEEEKLWLQAVNKVDGIKGILMNQTGLFRIRPDEFTQLRREMKLAIEEATGVPVKTQEWIDKMYPVTGKRFSDYYHLDVQQQALLYQWESFRRYQGITTPLYPSSWQALDIKIRDYYRELEDVFHESRYLGRYENGELIQMSIMELNRQLVEGTIGPSQWKSLRNDIQGGLAEAVRILGESPAYKDVPKTFEERCALLEERGVVTPTQTPDQELMYYYFELKPELKYNWESERMELDYDTYYAYIDILLESLTPAFRERLMERIQNDWTPMERLYWEFSRTYARPYRNIRDIVLRGYTDEQIKIIRRFEVARGTERAEILEVMEPEGKLIAGYQRKLREARQRYRILDPELDAWLYFFGNTDKFMSHESEEIYNNLTKKYLIPEMIGEAK